MSYFFALLLALFGSPDSEETAPATCTTQTEASCAADAEDASQSKWFGFVDISNGF
jgi:hypothetical protein